MRWFMITYVNSNSIKNPGFALVLYLAGTFLRDNGQKKQALSEGDTKPETHIGPGSSGGDGGDCGSCASRPEEVAAKPAGIAGGSRAEGARPADGDERVSPFLGLLEFFIVFGVFGCFL